MTLRKKTLIITGVMLVGLVGLLYFISQTSLLRSFAELETQNVRQNVERVSIMLRGRLATLNSVVGDWALWDDTYAFIQDGNQEYIKSNIDPLTVVNLQLNMMVFLDTSGRLVYGRAINIQTAAEVPFPQSLLDHLADHKLILDHQNPNDSVTGLIGLPEGILLFASRPIATSEFKGPIRGTMIVGRYLDAAEIETLADAARLAVSVWRIDTPAMPADFQAALTALTPADTSIFVQPLNKDMVAGYTLVRDVYNQPAFLLKVEMPRDIQRQGQTNLVYSTLAFLFSGLVFGAVMVLFLEKGVLSRLTHLSQSVNRIGASGDLSDRVFVNGQDELGRLAGEINKMLADLGRSEEALRKAHDELEIRVQQRTGELLAANQRLQQEMQERRLAEETVRQSEQRFRKIVSSFSDHIYVTEITPEGRYINHYLSDQIEIFTGYPVEKFLDDWSFWPTVVIHPEDRAAAALQATRLAHGQDSQLEYRLIRIDGEVIWVRDSGRTEVDAVSQSIFIYGLVSDITKPKRVEVALAHARDEATAANRLKSQLLANVSHDLRTPLNAILGYADMLHEGIYGSLPDKYQSMAERIIINTTHLTTLVSELLDQARLEAGTLKLKPLTFKPVVLVDEIKSTMGVLAEAEGLCLTGEITPDIPEFLWGDPTRLQQIINNLMGNAIKFTEQGSVHLRLYGLDAGHWAVDVSDTGPGIASEAQAYIFDPFHQVDATATRQHGGFGLGLSIVKQLVGLMEGQILVQSQPGQGSRFTVVLPYTNKVEAIE